ncbi:MAG: DUF456 family protein [Paenibacillaceae bacterium]
MEIIGWSLIIALLVVGMIGAVYPVLPGVLAIYGSFFVYGFFFSFETFGFGFWFIQTVILLIIMVADYAVGAYGVKKFGGSRASMIGSTIGIIIGPFIIPIPGLGLILGPFVGAFIAELIIGSSPKLALKASVGALIGFFASTAMRIILQLLMIIIFIWWLLWFS